jgi:hypothetical protein
MDESVVAAPAPAAGHDADAVARSHGYDRAALEESAKRLATGQRWIAIAVAVGALAFCLLAVLMYWWRSQPPEQSVRGLLLGAFVGFARVWLTGGVSIFIIRVSRYRGQVPTTALVVVFLAISLAWDWLVPIADVMFLVGIIPGVALGALVIGAYDRAPARLFDRPNPHLEQMLRIVRAAPPFLTILSGRVRWMLVDFAALTVVLAATAFLGRLSAYPFVGVSLAVLGATVVVTVGQWIASRRRSLALVMCLHVVHVGVLVTACVLVAVRMHVLV